MHSSVREHFIRLSESIDGKSNVMFCNEQREVRCGLDMLLPTAEDACQLTWRWRDTNKRARAAEIKEEWSAIKRVGPSMWVSTPSDFNQYSRLMLSNTEIYRSSLNKLLLLEYDLFQKLPRDYLYWPADAQMAVLQIVWEAGVEYISDELIVLLKKKDWMGASKLDFFLKKKRRDMVKKCFEYAHKAEQEEWNTSKLWSIR